MVSPSRCPPWQPERPGPTRREPRRAQRSYTTPRDTITQLEAVRIKLQGFVQQHKDEPSVKTFNDLRERISDYLAPFGAQLVFSFVDDLVGHQLGLDENPERDFANLERQRLVRLEDCTVDSFDGDLMGQIRFFQLTEFGFNFTATCEGRDPVNDLSEETTRRGS